jgi:C4-dicarboxylate-binding protein DctP
LTDKDVLTKKIKGGAFMKRRLIVSFIVLIMGTLLFSVGICPAQEKYKMRFNHGLPVDHFIAKQYTEWGTLITQRSKGVLKVEMFPSATLFKDQELIGAIQMGTIESGAFYPFNIAKSVPEFNVLSVPFTYYTTDQVIRVINSDVRTKLDELAAQKKMKIMVYIPYPAETFGLISTKPLKIPSDCKGKVLRATDNMQADLAKLWEGGASFLSGAELYMALQRGTIDGVFSTLQTLVERKLYEVAPYFTTVPALYVTAIVSVNKEYFEKLPEELQKIMLDVSKEIERNSLQKALESAKQDINYLNKKGLNPPYTPTSAEMALWQKGSDAIIEGEMKRIPGGIELLKKAKSIAGDRK